MVLNKLLQENEYCKTRTATFTHQTRAIYC